MTTTFIDLGLERARAAYTAAGEHYFAVRDSYIGVVATADAAYAAAGCLATQGADIPILDLAFGEHEALAQAVERLASELDDARLERSAAWATLQHAEAVLGSASTKVPS